MSLLKLLNSNNAAVLEIADNMSKKVELEHGLRQGCVSSPIPFLQYISKLEQ